MLKRECESKGLWHFWALAYGLSWLFWIPTALSGEDVTSTIWGVPYMLGGFGPSIAGIVIVYRSKKTGASRDFWERVVDFRRISAGWYPFILLVFPILFAMSFGLNSLFGNPLPEFETLAQIAANPLIVVGMVVIGLVAGPLAEELGWRGVALDRLQTRWSPFVAGLVVALFWGPWHLPLFFIHGTTQYAWGVGTSSFWLFMIATVPLSIVLTWVYNHNNRSILAAVLLHFTYNFTFSLVYPFSETVYLFQVILLFIAAASLPLIVGSPRQGHLRDPTVGSHGVQ